MTAGEETSNNGWVHWIAVICFLEWGLIHIVAGVGTLYFAHKPDIPSLLIFICQGAPEAVQAEAKEMTSWSPLNIRILAQHGLNLLWVGVWSTALAWAIASSATIPRLMFVMGLWPYFADVAYFYAIDLPHYGTITSEMQTVIVSIGLWAAGKLVNDSYGNIGWLESVTMNTLPLILLVSAFINKAKEIGASQSGYAEL